MGIELEMGDYEPEDHGLQRIDLHDITSEFHCCGTTCDRQTLQTKLDEMQNLLEDVGELINRPTSSDPKITDDIIQKYNRLIRK